MSSNGKTKIIKTEKRIVTRQKSPVKNNKNKIRSIIPKLYNDKSKK